MQIVIDISRKLYEYAQVHTITVQEVDEICDCIKNAAVLPKGHGRLIDADVVDDIIYDLTSGLELNYAQISRPLENIPTIIKADKEVE